MRGNELQKLCLGLDVQTYRISLRGDFANMIKRVVSLTNYFQIVRRLPREKRLQARWTSDGPSTFFRSSTRAPVVRTAALSLTPDVLNNFLFMILYLQWCIFLS